MGLKDWLYKFRIKKKEEEEEIFGDGAYGVPFLEENLIIDQTKVKFYNEFMTKNRELYKKDAIRYWRTARNYIEVKMFNYIKDLDKPL